MQEGVEGAQARFGARIEAWLVHAGARVALPPSSPRPPLSRALWELGLYRVATMSLSIDEPANSRLFVVAGRSTSVSRAWCTGPCPPHRLLSPSLALPAG